MNMLAIIPARGGSKGVPRKNLVDIKGKPLIAYTIEAALEAKKRGAISEVIVSTDDEEIANVSRRYGASVPFLRPQELANDTARSVDLMIHAHDFFHKNGCNYDEIILLQPTSPLRNVEDIEGAVIAFRDTRATSLISCYKEDSIHEFGLYHKSGNWGIALNTNHNLGTRRQEMPDLYVRNGAIYIVKSEYMIREKKVFDEKPAMYIMPKDRSINIDTMNDIIEARKLI